jgi:hypothetical protein
VDIPVLKYIDVLIGLSLVMVLASSVVLAITQLLLNSTFARARHLQRGLTRLITHIEPTFLREHSEYLSRLLLRHPLVGQQTMFTPFRKVSGFVRSTIASWRGQKAWVLPPASAGSVVQRDELAYLLVEFAAGEGPLMDPVDEGTTPEMVKGAQEAVARALRATGIEDPAATLRAVRIKVIENERADPDQPAARWRANAVTDCATSDFVGKLHAGFDSTMARTTDAFGSESKLWVCAISLIVAVALQIDSFELLKRLSVDDSFRNSIVEVATKVNADQAASPAATSTDAKLKEDAKASLSLLMSPKIELKPLTLDDVNRNVSEGNALVMVRPGVLFSWVLLSLGAPFWFDALKNLLKLRSVLAKNDEAERQDRQGAQPSKAADRAQPAAAAASAQGEGEAGDLAATGAVG